MEFPKEDAEKLGARGLDIKSPIVQRVLRIRKHYAERGLLSELTPEQMEALQVQHSSKIFLLEREFPDWSQELTRPKRNHQRGNETEA